MLGRGLADMRRRPKRMLRTAPLACVTFRAVLAALLPEAGPFCTCCTVPPIRHARLRLKRKSLANAACVSRDCDLSSGIDGRPFVSARCEYPACAPIETIPRAALLRIASKRLRAPLHAPCDRRDE